MPIPALGAATLAAVLDAGSMEAAARSLNVTPSAVSQRVRRAGWQEQVRGRELIAHHLSVADGRTDS